MPSASSIAATVATAPRPSRVPRARLISAGLLLPPAVAAAWLGPPVFDALVLLCGCLMVAEWALITGGGRLRFSGMAALATVGTAVGTAALWGAGPALLVVAAGTVAVAALVLLAGEDRLAWRLAGPLYIGAACVAILWIRSDPAAGLQTLLWLLVLVWAVDSVAYLAGRALGGPRLAPRISPRKTWAGLLGGMAAAAGVTAAAGLWLEVGPLWLLLATGLALALVEQTGDLFESLLKRQFGRKDSGRLIPGHGGVLDRLDGLLAVSLAVAVVSLASGRSPLLWQ